jgi:hypothetical protein
VQYSVGIQIVELNPVSKEEFAEERMQRKRKPSEEESEEDYLKSHGRPRDDFWPRDVNFCWVILQDAGLRGVLQILFQKLGLDLVAHGGRISINDLGVRLGLLRDGRGDNSGEGTSFAHGGGTQVGTLVEWEQRCTVMAGREEEDDDGGGVG